MTSETSFFTLLKRCVGRAVVNENILWGLPNETSVVM